MCTSKVEGEREGNRRWRVEAEGGGGVGGEEERRGSGWDQGDRGSETQRDVELEREREEGTRRILV